MPDTGHIGHGTCGEHVEGHVDTWGGLWARGRACGGAWRDTWARGGTRGRVEGQDKGRRQHRVSPNERERIVSSFGRIGEIVFPKVKMRNALTPKFHIIDDKC